MVSCTAVVPPLKDAAIVAQAGYSQMPCAHCKEWVYQWIPDEKWIAWPGDRLKMRYIFFCDKAECARARRLHMLHLPSVSVRVQEYMFSEFGAVYDRRGYLLWRRRGTNWISIAQVKKEGAFNLILAGNDIEGCSDSALNYDDYPVRTLGGNVIANDLGYEFRIAIYAGCGSKLYRDICWLQRRYKSKLLIRQFQAVSKNFADWEILEHLKTFLLRPQCPARQRQFG